jgi:type II secretory ATPase GspE/PulE/Tfp pilus assembly ATPase PilB-like protein/GAF domain-containing protein
MATDAEAAELEQRKTLPELKARIVSAQTMEDMLSGGLAERVAELIGADRATLFAIDTRTNQLYSIARSGAEPIEIRVERGPTSVVGFVASLKKPVPINLKDVYDASERAKIHPKLAFDESWDKKTGYRTRSLLTVPVLHDRQLLGVMQLLNKKDATPFGPRDVALAEEISMAIGAAFFNQNRIRSLKEGRRANRWDYLVDKGRISLDDLTKAQTDAAAAKVDLARHLIEKVGIDRADVERSLAVFFNCEAFKFTGLESIPEELRNVKFEALRQVGAAPVDRQGGSLVVVIDDPLDISRTDTVRRMYPETRVHFEVGLRDEILACIDRSYGKGDQGLSVRDLASQAFAVEDEGSQEDDSGKAAAEDSTLIKLVNQVIIDAYRKGASDIHVEPNGKEKPVVVRFRVDGDCVAYNEFPAQLRAPMVSRLKIMSMLDISERRKPQDGKIRFAMPDRVIELRVATIPTVNANEDVVMRILAASKPIPLAEMGMSVRNLAELRKIIAKPYGLVLCVGPTGSGKTTTLHSALGAVNTVDMKIWTAEDPVEITQYGLRQVQVNAKIGFTFANAMRSFLRADPDIIMVGEMRDHETAETGIEASLTGHLVFSTLHTNSAPETVTRLIEMGLDPFSFADALLGVLAQRLARKLCSKCKKQVPATEEETATVRESFGPEEADKRGWRPGALQLWKAAGCGSCGDSGYKGRIGLHELLITDDEMKRAITKKAGVELIRDLAIKGGMTTLLQDGIAKAVEGLTDLKQVLAVCSR